MASGQEGWPRARSRGCTRRGWPRRPLARPVPARRAVVAALPFALTRTRKDGRAKGAWASLLGLAGLTADRDVDSTTGPKLAT
eukprot:3212723-Prymnesium_polylepis.1